MENTITAFYCFLGFPCIQQETMLLCCIGVSGVSGISVFLLQATSVKGYHVFLLLVVCQKQKPHIDDFFFSVLHILGQEYIF